VVPDFRVGDWMVRPGLSSLTGSRRTSHITPKTVDVLVCLARRQGAVVSREEIFREVWPDTFVTEDALTRCIGELRRAFHDAPAKPAVIETIAKRGYRLLPAVEWGQPGSADSGPASPAGATADPRQEKPLRRRAWALAAVTAAALSLLVLAAPGLRYLLGTGSAPIGSIAVLPLANLSGDQQQEYFADGITEALITRLAQVSSLRVISRTTAMRYKGTRKSLPEIAREMGVDGILEGTVLQSGNRVRVTAQLIRGATDTHLWSGSFEGDLRDVLRVQADAAEAVVAQVRAAVRPQERIRLKRANPVVPEAYTEYLKGWYLFNRDQYEAAADRFEKAARIDPGFALAHAMLSEADTMMTYTHDRPVTERAIRAVEAARALDDTSGEVQATMTDIRFSVDGDWRAAAAGYRRAVEMDPGSVDAAAHYALALHALRRWNDALAENRRALSMDPASPRLYRQIVLVLVDSGRFAEAIPQLQKAIELDPAYASVHHTGALAYEALGREKEALASWLKYSALSADAASVQALEAAAQTAGIGGYWQERLRQLQNRARAGAVRPLDFARAYTHLGDKDRAMRYLEEASRQHASGLTWAHVRADWNPLHSDPRFQALMRRLNLPE
jgi:TolB-like protein/DNA-binding winged helix-turn-helix (wHTH) protein/Flp pilus assembly protein TadD